MSNPAPQNTSEDHRALIAILFTVGTFIIGIMGFFYGYDYAKTIFTAILPLDAIYLNSYFTSKGQKDGGA